MKLISRDILLYFSLKSPFFGLGRYPGESEAACKGHREVVKWLIKEFSKKVLLLYVPERTKIGKNAIAGICIFLCLKG